MVMYFTAMVAQTMMLVWKKREHYDSDTLDGRVSVPMLMATGTRSAVGWSCHASADSRRWSTCTHH